MKLSKKAESNQGDSILSVPPRFIIGVVLAAILIVASIPLVKGPLKILFTDPAKQAESNNFQRLLYTIEPDTVFRNEPIEFKKILVGIDKVWDNTKEIEKCYNTKIEKPEMCAGTACLCLYEQGFKNPTCQIVDTDYFVTLNLNENIFGIDEDIYDIAKRSFIGKPSVSGYNHLIVSKNCIDGMSLTNLYIKNFEKDGKKFVLIAPEGEWADERDQSE